MQKTELERAPVLRRARLPVIIVAAIGVALSVTVFQLVSSTEQQLRRIDAQHRVATHTNVIQGFIDRRLQQLSFGQALFADDATVHPLEFKRFAHDLANDFAGVCAVSWLPHVPAINRLEFEKTLGGAAIPQIRDFAPDGKTIPADFRSSYFPIFYSEPLGNEPMLGIDLASDGPRGAAIRRAIATGALSVTTATSLRGPLDNDVPGVLAFVPVFFIESHSIELMLPARELTGLIMAAYPIGEFIESTLKMLQPAGGLDIYVLETDEVGQENLLYFHPSRLRIGPYTPVPLGDMRRGWFEETQVRFGDRSWTLVFRPVEAAFAYREWPAAGAFSIGLVLTSLLTLYMFGAVTRRERIERLVGDRTNELSQVNAELNEKVGRLRTTEDALQKSQARFLQAMENDLDGVALFGANDRLIYCNERYRALCAPIADVIRPNVAFETMLTVAVQRGFIEEAIGCEAQWIQERMRRRHMPRGVMELRRSGRAVEIRENRAPDGSIFQVLSDVTEARLKEEHLNRAQKMEAVGAFAGGIAHDFNNILAVIRGYADLAKAFSRPDSPVAGHVTKIIRSVDRAAAVTKALLAFTRRRAPETRTVDLTRLLRDQKFLLKPLLKSKVELEISTDGPPLFARVDPDLFGQAIINLAINARDAMPAGGQLKLSIDCPPSAVALPPVVGSNGWARVMVADTGVGMDSETREQAFEPFFTTKGSGKGSGLGLAMVHRIVTQAGGSISVTSAPDCGTTFTIFLPTVEPPADVGAVEQMDDTMVPRTVRHTILLAEDEPELRTLLSDALSAAGHRVLTAQDGGTALEIFDEIAIDLLVTDILMPEVSGLELAALCKELRPALPVIYITGDPGPENDQGHDIPKGATVLFKPFAPARLMKAIDVALAAAKTTEESLV